MHRHGGIIYFAQMNASCLELTIQGLLESGKGILAADESLPTIGKRFKEAGISTNEENRGDYREMLFTTAGLNDFISGVILFDETIHQRMAHGAPIAMPVALAQRGVIPGIKVDKGTVALPNMLHEKFTQGLDGLRERLIAYRDCGARFTKWRGVFSIAENIPSRPCLQSNATALAVFAALSQEADLAPIVEPEILMDGSHTLARCEQVTSEVLEYVFGALIGYRVTLERMLLKTGMILSGASCPEQAGVDEVAEATIRCFRRVVPAAVPGIVFLSGGQADQLATLRLNAICKTAGLPWKLSFSFGRALQSSALKIWKGSQANVHAAQAALYHRAKCNALALKGKYLASMEELNMADTK